jgi:type VI secretion system protein ImpA
MSALDVVALDVDALLVPVSADSPCGENLEYDVDYVGMERAALGKPEQQFGSTLIPVEEPDWREVRSQALDLLSRSKDLRIGVYLTRALARTDGLRGLADGLAVLAGFIDHYWEGVHPQLDPDDGNDPTLRINSLASLCDGQAMLKGIREATLVRSRAIGKFAYRDVLVASGELPPPAAAPTVEQSAIDGAFADCDPEELKETARTLRRALALARSLVENTAEKVGAGSAPQLEPLTDLLAAMSQLVKQKLSLRGLSLDEQAAAEPSAEPAEDSVQAHGNGQPADSASNGRKASAVPPANGEISSREDVIRALDRICDYYKRYEPSSPVPLFLNRAKRLASKSFLEILRDLTPDALNQALAIGGIAEAAENAPVISNDV